MTPNEKADNAVNRVQEGAALVGVGMQDPGPAAGPRAAIAIGPLSQASSDLSYCADLLQNQGRGELAAEARSLARDASARAGELGFAAVVPWPFVYAPLGAIYNACLTLGNNARDFRSRIPIVLEPVPRRLGEQLRTTSATGNTDGKAPSEAEWDPSSFPWPATTHSQRH